jgi:hypothetical protein
MEIELQPVSLLEETFNVLIAPADMLVEALSSHLNLRPAKLGRSVIWPLFQTLPREKLCVGSQSTRLHQFASITTHRNSCYDHFGSITD